MNGKYTVEFLDAGGKVLGEAHCPAELLMKGYFSKQGQVATFRATDHLGTVINTGEVTSKEGDGDVRLNGTYVYVGDSIDLSLTVTHDERRRTP